MTCGEVRDWGGTGSFKAIFASVWIEWSSINSPLNWLLAEWLLLMLSSPHHNLLHTYRHNSDSRFEKSNIWEDQIEVTCLLLVWRLYWKVQTALQLMHTFRMHAVIQSRMQTISMIGSCRELQWNMQSKCTTARCAADHVRNNTHQLTSSSPA